MVAIQTAFRSQRCFGVRDVLNKPTILSIAWKLKTTGSLLSERENKNGICQDIIVNTYSKSSAANSIGILCRLNQEAITSYGKCERTANKAKLPGYKLQLWKNWRRQITPDKQKGRILQWIQAFKCSDGHSFHFFVYEWGIRGFTYLVVNRQKCKEQPKNQMLFRTIFCILRGSVFLRNICQEDRWAVFPFYKYNEDYGTDVF